MDYFLTLLLLPAADWQSWPTPGGVGYLSRPGPCSDLRTSMSTLQHSTLSVLNKYADLQMLVLFQMQYSVAHLTEMTSAARPRHPPNTLIH